MPKAALLRPLIVALFVLQVLLVSACVNRRRATRFLVPHGYVGWVRLSFGVPGAEALPVEGNAYVVKFHAYGVVATSSPLEAGFADDEYFTYDGDRLEQLEPDGPDRKVWARFTGNSGEGKIGEPQDARGRDARSEYMGFFVGSGDLYKRYADSYTQPGPVPDGRN